MLSQMLTVLLLLRWIRRVVIKSSYAGCVDEKLNVLTPHQEIPFSVSHVTPQDGQQIPYSYGLHILLESMKKDSLGLLMARLRELGISANTQTDFIEKAKGIVCNHNDIQKKKGGLEAEIRRLELDQENIITKKEKEILDAVLAQRSGVNNDANLAELHNNGGAESERSDSEDRFKKIMTSELSKSGDKFSSSR